VPCRSGPFAASPHKIWVLGVMVWVKDHMVLGHADYHYGHEPIAYGYAPGVGRWGRGAKGWYGGNDQSSRGDTARKRSYSSEGWSRFVGGWVT
jgi:hypothetical protein